MLLDHFIFVHMMKTGGTTFNRTIKEIFENGNCVFTDKIFRRYRRDEIVCLNKWSEQHIPMELDLNKHRFILGHFTVNKYKHLHWPMLTFLRDPVKRVVSYYSVWLHNKEGPKPKWPIEKFAKKTANYMHFATNGDLDQFAFIGLCERYVESFQIFERMFKIKVPDKKGWYNQTPGRKIYTPTQDEIDFVESVNKKDRKLYNKALVKFEEQVKKWL